MFSKESDISVKVWGDYACFTRPEFKVERVSYNVITPSAARGLLEAIFWKPEFRYQIHEILVLKFGSQITILRNEISETQATSPIIIEKKRQQRSSLILKNVAYQIKAGMILKPYVKDPVKTYIKQFKRKLKRGQCYHTPYLGTREFAAYFETPGDEEKPEHLCFDLGTMLFDSAFIEDDNRPEIQFLKPGPDGQRVVKGYKLSLFFNAKLEDGKLIIPPEKYKELYRLEGKDA
ncbi:MAG TPA: type I-C CRISPR-associated protein Cas5c [archaeon]|nr:type I-C CRISPR-associated protein Cas5c [archaeon]